MRISVKAVAFGLMVAATPLVSSPAVNAADMVIGAGESAPVHYFVARAICRAVKTEISGLSCDALKMAGRHAAEPLAVLNDVRNGAIEVGIAQSDWIHHAYQGTGPVKFMDVKFENLRTLFVLHGEPFTVIARRDARITKLDDLAGKRVNIGNPGSNQRTVMEAVMKAQGWTRKSFQFADELTAFEQSLALCHNRVQAMIATVAHPDPSIAQAIKLCGAEVVPITGAGVDKLLGANPYFAVTAVPGGVYEGHDKPTTTFGVRVAAVTSSDVPDDLAYAIVKAVADDLDGFKRVHPALGELSVDDLIKGGVTAPLHPGAEKYFREKGMM